MRTCGTDGCLRRPHPPRAYSPDIAGGREPFDKLTIYDT
jgi:hypothetical protein